MELHIRAPYRPLPMADPAPPHAEREKVGLELRKARKAAGLVTARAAELAGFSISQLSAIERGDHSLTSVSSGKLRQLPAAFGLGWEAFVDLIAPVYAAYIPLGDTEPSRPQSPGYTLSPPYQPRLIAHAGIIGAGISPLSYASDTMEKRWMPYHPVLEGYRDEDLITLDVAGDSMVCDEVRLTVPEGSTVYLHTRLEPQPGDIVAVWLERENLGVLKLWKPDADHLVLKSYNEHHRPIVLSESDAAQIQGVYLAHLAGGRRAHNAKAKMRR